METLHLRFPQGGERVFRHRGSRADQGVIEQMFKNRDYALGRLRRARDLEESYKSMAKPLILDAGAHIGASVCWFASAFPRSHIAAFEPEAANFELLRGNTEGLDVTIYNAALGARDEKVRIIDPGEGEWGYRTLCDPDGDVAMISVSRIVAENIAAGFTPFIAKIDIEGGESELFAPPTEWVDQFPLLIVELHDWLLPGQGTSRSFLKCMAALDRDFVHIGENVFSIRND